MAQMKIQLQKHYLNTVQSQYAEVMNTIYSQLNSKDQVITTISKKNIFSSMMPIQVPSYHP